jgi:hypothetical protein
MGFLVAFKAMGRVMPIARGELLASASSTPFSAENPVSLTAQAHFA